MNLILCTTSGQGWWNYPPNALDELFTSSCLQQFETRPNPISGSGLVPIGILVSSTTTLSKLRSHRGHVCVRSSQVNHPSNMPAMGLKLTGQDRSRRETHIRRGLVESGSTQRCCTQNLTTKSSKERPASTLLFPNRQTELRGKYPLTSTAGAK